MKNDHTSGHFHRQRSSIWSSFPSVQVWCSVLSERSCPIGPPGSVPGAGDKKPTHAYIVLTKQHSDTGVQCLV